MLITAPGLLLSIALASTGLAQNAEQGKDPGASATEPSSAPTISEISAPVLHIKSVEIIRSAHPPVIDIIRVRGVVSTVGWEEAELIPLSRGVPADGILEMIMVARAPSEAADARGFEEVEAIFPLETNHPFKGVNVHSASDSVSVMQLPGYAEGKPSVEDCSKCVGKTFVAKGAAAPAGKSASDLVREEKLPAATRIIRPSEGIPSADSNPNRLTLILNKEGKITAAVWD
ncbi:MAG TPA: hypothetical protein VMA54_12615 [Steroidobacteraceae bacterium]|nr:hypothetical protein [Steroidobacteraceae bacterium]